MRLRRCRHLLIEPVETHELDLADLLHGGRGLETTRGWRALAPHLAEPVPVLAAYLPVLGAVDAHAWLPRAALLEAHGAESIDALLAAGLIHSDAESDPMRVRDEQVRAQHWWTPAAVAWWAGMWRGVDSAADPSTQGNTQELVNRYGPPPPEVLARAPVAQRQSLPKVVSATFDSTLRARHTGRNFDPDRAVSYSDMAALLGQVFGARTALELAPTAIALKKSSPSGGGLHPVQAFVLARRVEDVRPGLYHYHPLDHALEPLAEHDDAALRDLALRAMAGQTWFAAAPLLVLMVARFGRNFWKYRNHAKAWRVVLLDAGHLSQTWQLLATERGLGTFVTAAINEHDLAQAFGFDPMSEGPLLVVGAGHAMPGEQFEFNPG